MASGIVRDIRTGRALGRTSSLTDTFIAHVGAMCNSGEDFYVASGPIRHTELVGALDVIRDSGITVVRDKCLPPDMLLIFSGTPEELGFAC
jgi:hypothetical protein